MKYLLFIFIVTFVFPFIAFAQEVAETVSEFPWKDNATATLVVLAVLGLLSMIVNKIPGKAGEIVQWLIDLLSANVKHQKK